MIPNLERRYRQTESDHTRQDIERYMAARDCRACQGKRLRPEALAVKVCQAGIMDVCARNIGQALEWVREIDPDVPGSNGHGPKLTVRQKTIGNQILKEIEGRLRFLENIGLDYVTLDRTARTLSGRRGAAGAAGDADRLRVDGGVVRLRRADGGAASRRRLPTDRHLEQPAGHGGTR